LLITLIFMDSQNSNFREGLTYDDVLLVPKHSTISSRKEVDLSVNLANGLKLNLPIISAAMDTVTESAMAIALARRGALGIVHRFNTIEKQCQEIRKVKTVENYFLDKPLSVKPKQTLREVFELKFASGKNSFVVVDDNNTLVGLLSKRDYIFETDLDKTVEQLMTPFARLVWVNDFISLEEAKRFFRQHKIEKLPVIDQNRQLKGLITSKDVIQCSNVKAVRDKKGRLLVGGAIGVKSDFLDRAKALVEAGADVLVLDIAHGHLDICSSTASKIKEAFPEVPLMVGNIATREGAEDLAKAGADIIKVGVGPGSVCTTRIVTGCGVPQLTAIMEARKGAGDKPIIADAGIKTSGDMVKALAAGASAVMLGGLFAGTDEAPGKVSLWNGRKVKLFRGMASFAAYEDKTKNLGSEEVKDFTAEGVDQAFVPHKGPVGDLLSAWEGGIKSGFSYCGARNLAELWARSEFIKISSVGIKENGAHDVIEV
jgi:IMP dehydrogenase